MKQEVKQENTLFLTIYELPLLGEEIKSYTELQGKIKSVSVMLGKLMKTNLEEIEKVCTGNSKLYLVAKLLRETSIPEGVKEVSYSGLTSTIISMFTLMMVSHKTFEFLNKMNIPFSLYRIVLRNYTQRGKIEFLKKVEVQESFKFFARMISIRVKKFPRLIANLLFSIISEYSSKLTEKEAFAPIISIACDLNRLYLKISAESGVLISMYKKAIEAELQWPAACQFLEGIICHMNFRESREIILTHLDLARAFAIFTYVDPRPRDDRYDEKVQRCAQIVEMLLSSTPTIFYFLYEKTTLKNFVNSLRSKNKSERELAVINERIFSRIIDRALRYDRATMERSNNLFGLNSNYLNLRALMVISFLLDNTDLFDIYLGKSVNRTFRDLGKLSLRYFPITFEKPNYNKEIIQSIGLPSMQNYEQLNEAFLSILSYTNDCILNFEFSREEFLSFLLQIRREHGRESNKQCIPDTILKHVEDLFVQVKESPYGDNIRSILIRFYQTILDVSEYLEWRPEYLKLSKFISMLFYHEVEDNSGLYSKTLEIFERIFSKPEMTFYRNLWVVVLDDIGRHLNDSDVVKDCIDDHLADSNYSFRISRILFHMDFDRKERHSLCQKDLLASICERGSDELVLLAIEIIQFYFHENDERGDWGARLICKSLLYHPSEEIVSAVVDFCEEAASKQLLLGVRLNEIQFPALRKRLMYLFLESEESISRLNELDGKFIRNELEAWMKEGPNMMKELAGYFERECKRYSLYKEISSNQIDVGTVNENRHKLIFLPWNVRINGEFYVALCSYKYMKEKIKLRVSPKIVVDGNLDINLFYIGAMPLFQNDEKSCLTIKREEIMRNYDKNKDRESCPSKKFVVSKDKVTLFLSYEDGKLVLERLSSQIMLSKYVYMPIAYPLNFINSLARTVTGMNSLRESKIISHCAKLIKEERDADIAKGAIEILGFLFLSENLQPQEKIEIYEVVNASFEETKNLELKEVGLWALNIIVKDEDFRKKIKENKGWLTLESKYCGWICYPQLYNKAEIAEKPLRRYQFLLNQLPERLENCPVVDEKGYQLIMKYLEIGDNFEKNERNEKNDRVEKENKIKKNEMLQYFKKPTNSDVAWNPKTLQRAVQYLSCIDHGPEKTKEVLENFSDYYTKTRFDKDFPSGLPLP